jgi:hypothetical protein
MNPGKRILDAPSEREREELLLEFDEVSLNFKQSLH